MSRTKYLLEQIERAKRFAAAVNNEADRARFEKIAADYQNEIDATAAPPGDQEPSAQTETASSDARASPGESAPSNAIASESENAPASMDSPQENKVLSLSGPSPGQSTGDRMD
jgi:hypothetical protein